MVCQQQQGSGDGKGKCQGEMGRGNVTVRQANRAGDTEKSKVEGKPRS